MNLITPAQVRGARGMLDWSMIDLAKAAGVSVSTIKRFEDEKGTAGSSNTVGLMRAALEAAGVRFLADEGDGAGLVLRPREASSVARFF